VSDDYDVLEMLARIPQEYVDGGAIVEETGHLEPQVKKIIAHLGRLGLPAESHPVYGHRLSISYDLIDRRRVSDQLLKRGLKWEVTGALEVGSTNDLANSAAIDDAPDGTTFFAEHQSKGRGRLGRRWHSPVGSGLWFSVLRKHDLPIEEGWRVTLGAGVAVARAISSLTGLDPSLKWPNDVQIEGRKVAGILTESRSSGNRLKNSTIGIGLNVHLAEQEFPPELREIATSIQAAGGRVKRGELLGEILCQLNEVSGLTAGAVHSAWREKCGQWGHRVSVERDHGITEGLAVDLAEDGAFVIEGDDGERFSVHSGDVTHLRTIS
jgi:BirA family biotin operon repressor/biotin-[acetyl-CoA-carboxylase] ligase